MLNSNEIEKLKSRDNLNPKARANLDYRVAQKIKSRLSELDEINAALCLIPEKNARRALNDTMVASLFHLTENIIGILRYIPVEVGPDGLRYVSKSSAIHSKDKSSIEFKGVIAPTTPEDEARHLLLREHIEKLQRFTQPFIRAPLSDDAIAFSGSGSSTMMEGHMLLNKWQGERKVRLQCCNPGADSPR